jgi:hypothetical protein
MADKLTCSQYADAILYILDRARIALDQGAKTLRIPEDTTTDLRGCVDLVRVWDRTSAACADGILETVGLVVAASHAGPAARTSILALAASRLKVLRDQVSEADDIVDSQLCPGPDERRMRRGVLQGTDSLVRDLLVHLKEDMLAIVEWRKQEGEIRCSL